MVGIVMSSVIGCLFATFAFWKTSGAFFFSIILVATILPICIFNLIGPGYSAWSPQALLFYVLLAVALSLTLSADVMRMQLHLATDDATRLVNITTKNGTERLYIVMVGEKGDLVYDPIAERFSFLRADDIVSLNWRR
jgi:hypothetical protein